MQDPIGNILRPSGPCTEGKEPQQRTPDEELRERAGAIGIVLARSVGAQIEAEYIAVRLDSSRVALQAEGGERSHVHPDADSRRTRSDTPVPEASETFTRQRRREL